MAKFTVVVPNRDNKMTTTKNHKGEIVGIPFLGESTRYIMDEDEFTAWLEMWRADSTLGTMFYVERMGR